tara:strand:+ start:42 stop:608 length:567 start_codon:yes stop_codon:yes gene_type:complete
MSANLKVNIKISDNARKIFDEIGVSLEDAVNIAMTDTADRMANDANSNLADSIGVNSTLFGSVMVKDKPFRKEITTNVDYAGYVEFGTGPSKRDMKGRKTGAKKYWPPKLSKKNPWPSKHTVKAEALEEWRDKKSKFKSYDDLRFAIFKKGTKPQRYMAKALQKNKTAFVEMIGKELARQSNGKIVKR